MTGTIKARGFNQDLPARLREIVLELQHHIDRRGADERPHEHRHIGRRAAGADEQVRCGDLRVQESVRVDQKLGRRFAHPQRNVVRGQLRPTEVIDRAVRRGKALS